MVIDLNRIKLILENKKFKSYLNKNEECEVKRKFCHHDLLHFLDVARIAYIQVLENRLNIKKDVVYGAALLHDIGKWKQYLEGIPHEISSANLSKDILEESGYSKDEINFIVDAILKHRKNTGSESLFNTIFYKSDLLSRNCLKCTAIDECNWTYEEKFREDIY